MLSYIFCICFRILESPEIKGNTMYEMGYPISGQCFHFIPP